MAIESLKQGLGDTPIIDIPAYDVIPAPTTGVTDSSATADTNITLTKQGAITDTSNLLQKMGIQVAPAAHPTATVPQSNTGNNIAKYAAIGLGGLGVLALIRHLVKRTPKSEKRMVVHDNPSYSLKTIQSAPTHVQYLWYMHAAEVAESVGAYGDVTYFRKRAFKIHRKARKAKEKWAVRAKSKPIQAITPVQVPSGKHKVKGTMKLYASKYQDYIPEYRHHFHAPPGSPKRFSFIHPLAQEKMFRAMEKAGKQFEEQGYQYEAHTDKNGDIIIEYYKNPRRKHRMIFHNPMTPQDKAVKVFTDFHGFEPTKIKEVTVPAEYPDKLVLIGKAHAVRYESNKINGAPDQDGTNKLYEHDLSKGSLWATDIHGKGLYLIDPKLEVRPEGLVH